MISIPVLVAVVLILLFILGGMPLGFALIMSVLAVTFFLGGGVIQPVLVAEQTAASLESFPLLAIPFFILAGEILNRANMTENLVEFTNIFVGPFRGGLAQVNIFSSMIFAGISGSAIADTSAIGSIMIPSMQDEGYSGEFSAAVTASSSMVGPIIPPSILMIIYATTITSVTVGSLFAAGILPGVLTGLLLMIVTYLISIAKGHESSDRVPVNEAARITVRSLPILFTPVILIGGILSGVFTPTESGAVASGYALLIATIIYRSLSLAELRKAAMRTALLSAIVLFVVGAAGPISWLITIEQVPRQVTNFLLSVTTQNTLLLLIVSAIFLILGMFIDNVVNILIWAPVFTPIAIRLGIDPLHFALVTVYAFNLGMITPPLAVSVFVASEIAGVRFESAIKRNMLYLSVMIGMLVLLVLIPQLTTYVPEAIGGI